jgi:hypothetical protein
MVGVIVLVHGGSRQARRMVKIFELAFTQEVTPLAWPALRLVFRSSFTHTQRQERRQSLKGKPMDWKHLLAYITGTVDQELLVRNELVGSRAGARTVGEGFPGGLFRLPVGFTVPPWPRFQLPPRQTERAAFPHSAFLLASRQEL